MIAVILPTRGLVFTQVEEALSEQLKDFNHRIFRSHDLPIPDAQNYLVEKALRESHASHFLFIEEDTVLPKGGLEALQMALYTQKADIACIDYSVNGWSCTVRNKLTDELLWCGFGCTLVKREVLEKLGNPWFRTDKTLRLNDWEWIDNPSESAYGGQDIWFCTKAREAGFKLVQVKGREASHLMLVESGTPEVNKGIHFIGLKSVLIKQQFVDVPEKEEVLTINGHSVTVKEIGNNPTQP